MVRRYKDNLKKKKKKKKGLSAIHRKRGSNKKLISRKAIKLETVTKRTRIFRLERGH